MNAIALTESMREIVQNYTVKGSGVAEREKGRFLRKLSRSYFKNQEKKKFSLKQIFAL